MAVRDEIQKAISAHGMWKQRLLKAIESGSTDLDIPTVRRDDQCEFGCWLHGTISHEAKLSAHYGEVRGLHAKFHTVAARVLEMATRGQKGEASASLALGGEYANASAGLTKAMMDWSRETQGVPAAT